MQHFIIINLKIKQTLLQHSEDYIKQKKHIGKYPEKMVRAANELVLLQLIRMCMYR